MRGQASAMAFCGVTAALAVVLMIAGGWLPAATYCAPVAASLLLAFAAGRCGKRLGLCWFFAVALLSLLLTQDKEAALVFLCLGYYPLLRPRLQRLACRPVRLAVKLAVFLAGSAAALAAAWLILGLPWRETAGLTAALLALAAAAVGVYARLLGRLARRFAKM